MNTSYMKHAIKMRTEKYPELEERYEMSMIGTGATIRMIRESVCPKTVGHVSVVLVAAMAMSASPVTTAAAQSDGFSYFDEEVVKPKKVKDNGTCNITDALTTSWLGQTKYLSKLHTEFIAAYEKIAPDTSASTSDEGEKLELFGPPGDLTKQVSNRRKAKEELRVAGGKLLEIAQRFATYQLSSCGRCRVGDSLGAIASVASNQQYKVVGVSKGINVLSKGTRTKLAKLGRSDFLNIKTITKQQAEDENVIKLVKRYHTVLNTLNSFPQKDANRAACGQLWKKFATTNPAPDVCGNVAAQLWVARINNQIYDALKTSSSGVLASDFFKNKPSDAKYTGSLNCNAGSFEYISHTYSLVGVPN